MLKIVLVLAIAVPVAVFAAGQLGWLQGTPPADLGVRDGRLKPPSSTPNSVSSQASLYPDHPQRASADIDPLPLKGGDAAASLRALRAVLEAQPGLTVTQQTADYLRATARTRWLRFVDDLEFWIDPAGRVIALRSASRLGRKDFGTNRARIEAIRAAYGAATAQSPGASAP